MNIKRVLLVFLITLLLLVISAVAGWCFVIGPPFIRIAKLQQAFDQVQSGMSEEKVISIMGPPTSRSSDPIHLTAYPELAKSAVTIRSTLRYTTKTFFLPVTFEVVFTDTGLLAGKYRYD